MCIFLDIYGYTRITHSSRQCGFARLGQAFDKGGRSRDHFIMFQGHWPGLPCPLLGPLVVPFYPFFREGSPTKIDYRKKLEDQTLKYDTKVVLHDFQVPSWMRPIAQDLQCRPLHQSSSLDQRPALGGENPGVRLRDLFLPAEHSCQPPASWGQCHLSPGSHSSFALVISTRSVPMEPTEWN